MEREEIHRIYEAWPDAVINRIEQLLATIAKLEERVKSLEERLNKNSRNSSKPLSTCLSVDLVTRFEEMRY